MHQDFQALVLKALKQLRDQVQRFQRDLDYTYVDTSNLNNTLEKLEDLFSTNQED